MKEINKKWEGWAELVLRVFPRIKKEDTKREAKGVEKIISEHLKTRKKLKIIDVCCGWGRHCFELVKREEVEITGIDISSHFINYADRKLKKQKGEQKPQFIARDLFDVNFREEFDVALNLWTSFGLYEDDRKNLEMLKKISSFLRPEGIFILDVVNRERLATKLSGLLDKGDYIQGNKYWWKIKDDVLGLAQVDFDIKKSISRFRFFVFEKDTGIKGKSIISLRIYSLSEIENMLKRTGFEVKSEYGDFNLTEYTSFSPRLIVVAEKRTNTRI